MKIERSFRQTERYEFDWGDCSHRLGFAQIDTRQDAPYYGAWANASTRRIVEYCEGDISITTCDTDDEFVEQIRAFADTERFIGIDGMCSEPIIAAFRAVGLGDLLH